MVSYETDAEKKQREAEEARRCHDEANAEQERRAREWLEKNAKPGKRGQFAIIALIIALIFMSTFTTPRPARAGGPSPTFTPAICAQRDGCDGPPLPIRFVYLPLVIR